MIAVPETYRKIVVTIILTYAMVFSDRAMTSLGFHPLRFLLTVINYSMFASSASFPILHPPTFSRVFQFRHHNRRIFCHPSPHSSEHMPSLFQSSTLHKSSNFGHHFFSFVLCRLPHSPVTVSRMSPLVSLRTFLSKISILLKYYRRVLHADTNAVLLGRSMLCILLT